MACSTSHRHYPPRVYPAGTPAAFLDYKETCSGGHPELGLYTFIVWRAGLDWHEVARMLFAHDCFGALHGILPAPFMFEHHAGMDVVLKSNGELNIARDALHHPDLILQENKIGRFLCWDLGAEYLVRVIGSPMEKVPAVLEAETAYLEVQGLVAPGLAEHFSKMYLEGGVEVAGHGHSVKRAAARTAPTFFNDLNVGAGLVPARLTEHSWVAGVTL